MYMCIYIYIYDTNTADNEHDHTNNTNTNNSNDNDSRAPRAASAAYSSPGPPGEFREPGLFGSFATLWKFSEVFARTFRKFCRSFLRRLSFSKLLRKSCGSLAEVLLRKSAEVFHRMFFSAQCLRKLCGSLAEAVIFHFEMTNRYC